MTEPYCLLCGETRAAIRFSQRGQNPIYCWDEVAGEAAHHMFSDTKKNSRAEEAS